MSSSHKTASELRGQTIKAYREIHSLTQFDLAQLVGVEDKTIRNWETGKALLIRDEHSKKLHENLGMPLKLLNEKRSIHPQDIQDAHTHIKLMLDRGAYIGAFTTSELIIHEHSEVKKNGTVADYILPAAYQTFGIATATLYDDPQKAQKWFRQMESALKASEDTIAKALSCTGQAEMYRRMSKLDESYKLHLDTLALLGPQKEYIGLRALVAGNCMQMLARTLLDMGRDDEALDYLYRARELTQERILPGEDNHYYLCFGALSVQADIVKVHMLSNNYKQGLVELAKFKILTQKASPRWKIQSYIKEGEFYVRLGRSNADSSMTRNGMKLLEGGYKEANKMAHTRQQQTIQRLINRWWDNSNKDLEFLNALREDLKEIDEKKDKLA